jgi:hypothetical protein
MLLKDTAVQLRSSIYPPERQRSLVRLPGFGEPALILEQDADVVERRGHGATVADLLTRGQRLFVHALCA